MLSQKIDLAYNSDKPVQEPAPFAYAQPTYAQPMAQPAPQYAPAYMPQGMPAQNGYAPNYAQPMPAPVSNTAFEPDDPIPEQKPEEPTDRKHRPRFVDFFMKRNNDGK